MSVSRSLHAYRMDRIWLKAPIAVKVRGACLLMTVDCWTQSSNYNSIGTTYNGTVWLACIHWHKQSQRIEIVMTWCDVQIDEGVGLKLCHRPGRVMSRWWDWSSTCPKVRWSPNFMSEFKWPSGISFLIIHPLRFQMICGVIDGLDLVGTFLSSFSTATTRWYLHRRSEMGNASWNLSRTCMVPWAFSQLFSGFMAVIFVFFRNFVFQGCSKSHISKDEFQALLHSVLGSCPPPCTKEPHFQAVDGAIGRVCRGLTPTDNANIYFTVRVANSTDQCKQLCRDYPGCKGRGRFGWTMVQIL